MRRAVTYVAKFLVPKRTWKRLVLAMAFLMLLAVATVPTPAFAQAFQQGVANLIGGILTLVIWFVGKLLLIVIFVLTQLAQYNDFVTSPAVSTGWVIVRDVANMFFIVVLLVIAFATILNVASYQYKQMLPQLIIAALLINFSKTIAGIFIDVSQVVMLTFVNGFVAAAGGNFASMFQINNLFAIDPATAKLEGGFGSYHLVGGYLLALVLVLIALATMVVLTVILAFRIVMLWALVVLSPLPYLLRPLGHRAGKYGQQWWDEFFKYLITGPVLAFFIWLALVTVGSGNLQGFDGVGKIGGDELEAVNTIGTKAGGAQALIAYVIGISMLIAGLKIAGDLGAVGSGFANTVRGNIGKAGKFLAYKYSGARFASERFKGVMAGREAVRKGKVEKSVAGWQARYGWAQEKLGATMRYIPGPGLVGTAAGAVAGRAAGGWRSAKQLEDKAKQHRKEAQKLRDQGNFVGAEKEDQEAAAAARKAGAADKWARRVERGTNIAGVGVLAATTGGIGLAFAPLALGRDIRDTGKKIRQKGEDFTFSKAMEGRKDVKDLKPEEILNKAHGGDLSAILEAAEQQLIQPGELEALEELLLQGSGKDKKTMQVFERIVQKKYFGTRTSAEKADVKAAAATKPEKQKEWKEKAAERTKERKRAIESGLVDTRSIVPSELAVDNGSLARDFVIHGTKEQRKELGRDKARKLAYKAGLRDAVAAASVQLRGMAVGTPEHTEAANNQQKLRTELMRLGKVDEQRDPTTGAVTIPAQTAYEHAGMDVATFGTALRGADAYELIVNLDATSDLSKPGLVQAIAHNLSAAKFRTARGTAARDEDTTKADTVAKIEAELKKSPNYRMYDGEQRKVRDARDRVGDVKQALNAADPADQPRLQGELATARAELHRVEAAAEAALARISEQEQELYESLKTKRK